MAGLDSVGKTTILYWMLMGEDVKTLPTVGFNVETININKYLSIRLWDVGGGYLLGSGVSHMWKHYYKESHAVVYVVDSSDIDRMEQAKTNIQVMSEEEDLAKKPFLVFTNKQDLSKAISPNDIVEKFDLKNKLVGREWRVQGSSAIQGKGLKDGFDWLAEVLMKNEENKKEETLEVKNTTTLTNLDNK